MALSQELLATLGIDRGRCKIVIRMSRASVRAETHRLLCFSMDHLNSLRRVYDRCKRLLLHSWAAWVFVMPHRGEQTLSQLQLLENNTNDR